MTADEIQELFTEASCFRCYTGANTGDLLKLALLDRAFSAPVNSFIERAGITSASQIAAVEALYLAAVQHGWWSKSDLIYPFVGGTAQAHAQNLKSSSFTITWNGTITHDANGITGSGLAGSYGDTGYIPVSSGQMQLNSTHAGAYRRNSLAVAARHFFGATVGGGILRLSTTATATTVGGSCNDGVATSFTLVSLAFIASVRNDAVNKHVFTGPDDKLAVVASVALPTGPMQLLALNGAGASLANLAGFTAGSGITFAEFTVMAQDWQTFNTALGRAV